MYHDPILYQRLYITSFPDLRGENHRPEQGNRRPRLHHTALIARLWRLCVLLLTLHDWNDGERTSGGCSRARCPALGSTVADSPTNGQPEPGEMVTRAGGTCLLTLERDGRLACLRWGETALGLVV